MNDPKFEVGDLVDYYDGEELFHATVNGVSIRGDKVWYKIRTNLNEIAFVTEDEIDERHVTS